MNDNAHSAADTFGLIADEFVNAIRQGKQPTVEEFASRYPEHADEIREVLPALVMIERAKDDDTPRARRPADAEVEAPPIKQLGDYQILREVARGGMGVVYEAEQLSLGRHVAIKVLPAVARLDPRQLGRFQREARSAARLHHTNIVPVFGVGEEDGLHYYVMQFIQGLGLDLVLDELRRLRQPRAKQAPTAGDGRMGRKTDDRRDASAVDVAHAMLSGAFQKVGSAGSVMNATVDANPKDLASNDVGVAPSTRSTSSSSATIRMPGQSDSSTLSESGSQYWLSVARVGMQVADALAHAASQGILHRDIKPSNLLLDDSGNVWVTDFGLAKAATDGDDLTHTGDVVGTMRYMAPERFNGQGDIRSDVYSLGLTLYELLALRPAFDETDRNKLVRKLLHDEPAPPRKLNPGVPRDLETVVLKAISRDPAHRYQTPAEMAEDLKRFVEDRPVRARRTSDAEKLWRWCRRNPGISTLAGALAAVLVVATVASLFAANHFNRLRLNESHAAQNERDARQAESLQREVAQAEKNRADIMLADMYASRGLLAGERGAPAEAALWFVAATDQSFVADDSQRQQDNLMRARNWMRRATLPVASMSFSSNVHYLEFQPNGDLLLTRYGKDEVMIWSWRTGQRLPWTEKLAGVASAQFSPDGETVALASTGEIHVHKVADGEVIAKIEHKGHIGAVKFNPNGQFLAVASNIVRIWDIAKREFLSATWEHPQVVTALTFNRKGDRLITTCADRQIRIFAVDSKSERKDPLYAPLPHVATTSPPALIDEDRAIVTVTGVNELTRWNLATGKPNGAPIRTGPRNLQGVTASPDGKWFATGGYNGPEIFATDSKRPPIHLKHTNMVRMFEFSPDNTALLTVSHDQTARLWSLSDGQPIGDPLRQMAIANDCAWSQDGQAFATTQYDGLVRVWQRPSNDRVKVQEPKWGQNPRISFDGRLAVPGIWHEAALGLPNNVNRLRILNTKDLAVAADVELPGMLIDSCICGDNRAAAAIFSQGAKTRFGVWDVETARPRFEPIELSGAPFSIAARPTHGQLAVLCNKGELFIFDDKTGNCVLKLQHERSSTTPAGRSIQVEYSADGKSLVSIAGSSPHTINVRDAGTGQLRYALKTSVLGANFHNFCLSADGKLLAAYTLVKNSVQVWDVESGRPLSEPLLHPGDYWGIFSVRFSPDGQRLLTSHKDGQVRYWDWKAGKLACPPMVHDDETHDALITPDGRFALTAMSGRPEIHVWELKTGRRVAPAIKLGMFDFGFCFRFALTADGRQLLVCYFSGNSDSNLAVVDLDSILSPCRIPAADMALLAELTTAQRIELGDLSGLTIDQWIEKWNKLRERNPELSRSIVVSPKSKSR